MISGHLDSFCIEPAAHCVGSRACMIQLPLDDRSCLQNVQLNYPDIRDGKQRILQIDLA